jgi:hypothetical protein
MAQQPPSIRLDTPYVSLAAEFTQVTSVRELSDGSVLVADRAERRLVLLDWATGSVTEIGRTGDGPGEFRNILQLQALANDSTLVVDDSRRRWLLLNGSRAVATLQAPERLNESVGVQLHGVDSRGYVLGVQGFFWSGGSPVPDRYSADSLLVIRAHRSRHVIDTIARIRGRGESNAASARRPGVTRTPRNPLPLEDQALLFSDGWIALAFADPYQVAWYTPEGRLIRGKPLPFARIGLDTREKCAALKRANRNSRSFECRPEVVPNWPPFVPAFVPDALLPLPDGRLAVHRMPSAGASMTMYDIIDRSGSLSLRLSLAENERIAGFGGNWVYVVLTAEDGIQRLRRYRFPSLSLRLQRGPERGTRHERASQLAPFS